MRDGREKEAGRELGKRVWPAKTGQERVRIIGDGDSMCTEYKASTPPGRLSMGPLASGSFPLNWEGGSKLSPVPPCRDNLRRRQGPQGSCDLQLRCLALYTINVYHGQQDVCKGNPHGRKASSRHIGPRGVRDSFGPIRGKQYFTHRCILSRIPAEDSRLICTSGRKGEMQSGALQVRGSSGSTRSTAATGRMESPHHVGLI